jgi:hypothetical protein
MVMKTQRALADAVDDRMVEKVSALPATIRRKRRNYAGTKILIALLLGFAGGLTASRWIKLI